MISFNTVVVSELLADIKGEPTTAEAQTSDATSEPEVSESTRPDKELSSVSQWNVIFEGYLFLA